MSDKISYTFGVKVNIGNYESANISFSYTSDLLDGESLEEGTKRIRKYVEKVVEQRRSKLLESMEDDQT